MHLSAIAADGVVRSEYLETIGVLLRDAGFVILAAPIGVGAVATAKASLGFLEHGEPRLADGSFKASGYLAGFEDMILDLIRAAELVQPSLLQRHEQTLKRLWPRRNCGAFVVPRDLTNTASRNERTRFYHYEYQNKLLVGLAEFLAEALTTLDRCEVLLIENGDELSPTSSSFIEILRRKGVFGDRFHMIIVERGGAAALPDCERIRIRPLSVAELQSLLPLDRFTPAQQRIILARAEGSLEKAHALMKATVPGNAETDFSFEVILDLHLSSWDWEMRLEAARNSIGRPISRDFLAQRNLETLPLGVLDEMHVNEHERCMAQYHEGLGPLVLLHALAIDDVRLRAEALVEPSEALMAIGLYDTWFAFLASHFSDPRFRTLGSGDDPFNGTLINAAFVLYSMGRSEAALPFLEGFLEQFPNSHYIPTVLYAQSMTYGRYQLPVDLPKAEECALSNLEQIEAKFLDHPRYVYIKVFAENAYAYIKARQGCFEEALKLCESGIRQITQTYGDAAFKLHRSILIYNTSQVYELVGEWGLAEARLREAIACDPYYAEYHNDLGNLLSRQPGREGEALQCYAEAINLSPPYYEAHINRGMLLAQLGDVACCTDFERAIDIKPTEWRAFRELGNAKLLGGQFDDAWYAYNRALALEVRDPDLYSNAAIAASELGLSEAALALAYKALEAAPKHQGAHSLIASELAAHGLPKEALFHARAAAQDGSDLDLCRNVRILEDQVAELGVVGID